CPNKTPERRQRQRSKIPTAERRAAAGCGDCKPGAVACKIQRRWMWLSLPSAAVWTHA
ncbi:hypothetical protein ABVT39_006247, partial [Epinephelus coioides]